MDKLSMRCNLSSNRALTELELILPEVIIETKNNEGAVVKKIDVNKMKMLLGEDVADDKEERFQFTWPDKKKSGALSNVPTTNTLRLCKEDSVNYETTENVYIEGDNLEVLKILQETYLGKIRVIYIDPPYNTGSDLVYYDDFMMEYDEYVFHSGQLDEEGNKLIQNTESNGRFHTDWLNMMYPRLKLAKNLLSDDGVIFISIGEEELFNLKLICDEIFGAKNYISNVTRVAKTASNMGNYFAASTDYILCYAKNINILPEFKGEVDESLYKKIETEGKYKGEKYRDDVAFFQSGLKHGGSRYPITCPDGQRVNTPDNKPWRANEATFTEWCRDGRIVFKETNTSPLIDEDTGERAHWNLYTKSYLFERQEKGTLPRNILTEYINRKGADLIKTYGIPFDFAKPVELLEFLLKIVNDKNCIILDFFSGSATMAHATMNLNSQDAGNRKFIMVQLPESTDDKSEAYRMGFRDICQIGKERIRRVGKKIENNSVDIGFRVFKVDTTNMKDVYYNPSLVEQQSLFDMTDNIKEDRTPEDLLFQVMLDLGVLLSSKIEEKVIAGKKVFNVADGFLIACFDSDVTEETVKAVAQEKPYYAVFRDSSMANDSVATNFEQIFATYSPETVRKVL